MFPQFINPKGGNSRFFWLKRLGKYSYRKNKWIKGLGSFKYGIKSLVSSIFEKIVESPSLQSEEIYEGYQGGGASWVDCGTLNNAWLKCKDMLQLFDPNWVHM